MDITEAFNILERAIQANMDSIKPILEKDTKRANETGAICHYPAGMVQWNEGQMNAFEIVLLILERIKKEQK